jgi:hypothetical protein
VGENGFDSGGRGTDPATGFDALKIGEGQASIRGCFENGCGDLSGAVTYDSLLTVRQKTRCVSRESVEGVGLLRRMETVMAGGRDPVPGDERAGVVHYV